MQFSLPNDGVHNQIVRSDGTVKRKLYSEILFPILAK